MILKTVQISGSVGKQVVSVTGHTILKGLTLTPSAANASIHIRDGKLGASGEIVYFARATSANGSFAINFAEEGMRFDKGLHVTVLGTLATAYLYLN